MLIPSDVRARLRGLRFASRLFANGLGLGQHRGRSRGAGLEFEQYRSYEIGDEPRRIDWKLYGRSDRFFVREAARDSPLTVWVLLDATASMAQADTRRPSYTKFEAAKLLAACLAEIAVTQGDNIGVIGITGNGVQLVAAGGGARHRDRLLIELDEFVCGGRWPNEAMFAPVWERVTIDSLVVIISDGFDAALPVVAQKLAAARRQVLSLGIVAGDERDFPFTGGFIFRDPETGAECRVDGTAARADFLARFAAARRELSIGLARHGVPHIEHYLDEPADVVLRRILAGAG
jgi:uncharacterized protein (DUF58 family)